MPASHWRIAKCSSLIQRSWAIYQNKLTSVILAFSISRRHSMYSALHAYEKHDSGMFCSAHPLHLSADLGAYLWACAEGPDPPFCVLLVSQMPLVECALLLVQARKKKATEHQCLLLWHILVGIPPLVTSSSGASAPSLCIISSILCVSGCPSMHQLLPSAHCYKNWILV